MGEHTPWHDLPAATRDAVAARTGRIRHVTPVADGLTCAMAAILDTEHGDMFVKGVPVADAQGVAAQQREREANPAARPASPRLLWRADAGGWDLLAFDAVPGRHANLASPSDRALVAEALLAVQDVRAPGGLPRFADRFAGHLGAGDLALLDGDALLHTDTNPHNLLVGDGRAWVVDWAMASRGPAWVDVAHTAVRLMEADCTPAEALEWAARFPSWRSADPAGLAAFVRVVCREWEAVVGSVAAGSSNSRYLALLGMPARA
ncbi:phosphotransferase [Streptomyces sp. NPDC092296]|uniref:phosphotransferase n=1 Tax=Streptomyces sp. NPDC092296 TaxID=3366012 RepID=UPI00381F9587